MKFKQPELVDEWGTRFYGSAETATGEVWWYDELLSNGSTKRRPLIPVEPITHRP